VSLTLNQFNEYKQAVREVFTIGILCHQSHLTISDNIKKVKGPHSRNKKATAYERGYIDGIVSAGFENIAMTLTTWVYLHATKDGETKIYDGWLNIPPELRKKYPVVDGVRVWRDQPTSIYYGTPTIMVD